MAHKKLLTFVFERFNLKKLDLSFSLGSGKDGLYAFIIKNLNFHSYDLEEFWLQATEL